MIVGIGFTSYWFGYHGNPGEQNDYRIFSRNGNTYIKNGKTFEIQPVHDMIIGSDTYALDKLIHQFKSQDTRQSPISQAVYTKATTLYHTVDSMYRAGVRTKNF